MKLSFAWIFDHINADWKQQDINLVVSKFNTTTAEIECFKHIKFALNSFFLAKLEKTTSNSEVSLSIPELQTKIVLPLRPQINDVISNKVKHPIFMIKKLHHGFEWATLHDFGVEKDGLMPSFDATTTEMLGGWRQNFQDEDIIIEIDNKSITHRPDMWGHRGFAREIAALLDLPFKDAKKFLAKREVLCFDQNTEHTLTCPIIIKNQSKRTCSRFCGLYFNSINNVPSNLLIASRLLMVGLRPINGIIDAANYLMQDWGQPVHTYDANKIEGQEIVIRMAKFGEKLALLDGNEIELTDQDLVIADASKPMCLAGVKGGINSAVDATTTSIFLEAATFDAATVRKGAFRHKTRTDSSARFEKTLDPNLPPEAVLRFLELLRKCRIKFEIAREIIAVGHESKETFIEVDHDFLSKRIGVNLTKDDIINPLTKIEFKVNVKKHMDKTIYYQIKIPSFRASKDIKIKEDILEEITRFYGFYRIPLVMPMLPATPFDFSKTMRLRKIKNYLVSCAKMTEQQNYAFADEEFLAEIDLKLNTTPRILNPVSQNNLRLIDSLLPCLFKNIKQNHIHKDSLAFFEFGKIWNKIDKKIIETKNLAGVFIEKRIVADFYQCKQHIIDMLKLLDVDTDRIQWQKAEKSEKEWYAQYQCANIIFKERKIGTIGVVDQFFLSKLKIHDSCTAIAFELDGNWLLEPEIKHKRYAAFSKFQESYFDLSFMIPLSVKYVEIKNTIQAVSTMIKRVDLIDFFEKNEWTDVRALTFRVWIEHFDRTLEKNDIDTVMQQTITNVEFLGAKLRM